jgi:hypothetical protein
MLAGLMLPGKPVGNMYFAAWSHNVISNAVNLSADLKMGEYRKFTRLHVEHQANTRIQSRFHPASCSSLKSGELSLEVSSTTPL